MRVFQPPPQKAFDPNLNAETETYEGEVTFLLDVRSAGHDASAAQRS